MVDVMKQVKDARAAHEAALAALDKYKSKRRGMLSEVLQEKEQLAKDARAALDDAVQAARAELMKDVK